jgi:hypothetical protein
MLDLELLHNFSTSTCLTIHNDPALKALWKINVPQLGFQSDLVMRGILAVSALHMARFSPDKREFYLSQALVHHQSGLRNAASILPHVTEENCTELYIFSALTLVVNLASPRSSQEFLTIGQAGIAEWLSLLKGIHSIITTARAALRKSMLAPMFDEGERRNSLREACAAEMTAEEDPLQDLRHYLNRSSIDEKTFHLCHHAVEELRKSFSLAFKAKPHDHESVDVFVWFFRVPEEYFELLHNHCQEAIAVFGYFCVLLKYVDYKWWMEGSSLDLLETVYELLDEEHKLWIRWPIEEIGWIPRRGGERKEGNVLER